MSRLDNPYHDQEAGRADSTQDTTRIDDVRIGAVRPLISPALLQDDLPVPLAVQTLVEKSRVEIADIIQGRDDNDQPVVAALNNVGYFNAALFKAATTGWSLSSDRARLTTMTRRLNTRTC